MCVSACRAASVAFVWCLVIPALATSQLRPSPTASPPETAQFDFLLGEWRFDAVWKLPEGERTGGGTWSARRALDGFAVVDEWRVRDPASGETLYLGASTRTYDADAGRWELAFLDVFGARHERQYGEWRDGDMHLWWTGTDAQGRSFAMRVRYFDITAEGFRWEGDRSYDGGETWIDGWLTMAVRRTGPVPSSPS